MLVWLASLPGTGPGAASPVFPGTAGPGSTVRGSMPCSDGGLAAAQGRSGPSLPPLAPLPGARASTPTQWQRTTPALFCVVTEMCYQHPGHSLPEHRPWGYAGRAPPGADISGSMWVGGSGPGGLGLLPVCPTSLLDLGGPSFPCRLLLLPAVASAGPCLLLGCSRGTCPAPTEADPFHPQGSISLLPFQARRRDAQSLEALLLLWQPALAFHLTISQCCHHCNLSC